MYSLAQSGIELKHLYLSDFHQTYTNNVLWETDESVKFRCLKVNVQCHGITYVGTNLTMNGDLDLVHLSTHSINQIHKFLLSRVQNGNKVFCVLFSRQSTSEEPQGPVHHLQNTAFPVICYKTVCTSSFDGGISNNNDAALIRCSALEIKI